MNKAPPPRPDPALPCYDHLAAAIATSDALVLDRLDRLVTVIEQAL